MVLPAAFLTIKPISSGYEPAAKIRTRTESFWQSMTIAVELALGTNPFCPVQDDAPPGQVYAMVSMLVQVPATFCCNTTDPPFHASPYESVMLTVKAHLLAGGHCAKAAVADKTKSAIKV